MPSDSSHPRRRGPRKVERAASNAQAGERMPGSGLEATRSNPRPSRTDPPAQRPAGLRLTLGAVLVAAVVLVYANTFRAPFRFDDLESITGNASIRDLGSFGWLRPPATGGETVSGRPVLNLSFALNYAIGGLDVRGYHAVNVAFHALAALVLFGIVRRTLERLGRGTNVPPVEATPALAAAATWPGPPARVPERGQAAPATYVLAAFVVAALWALHPLQTGAVSYVVQRAESLAGLFYLLTLYGFLRGAGSGLGTQLAAPSAAVGAGAASCAPTGSSDRTARQVWWVISFVSCLLGMATKETVATAPLVVLLYDRAFVAGSFAGAWRARARYHLALASTWLVLGALVLANRDRGGSAGFGAEISPWEYLVTQAEAIPHYLRLVFWPAGQVFDYGTATARLADVWPQALLLLGLGGAGAWTLARNRASGFLIATFFLLLAPSSSVVPVATQTIAEHRMYLPLAAVIIAAALVVCRLSGAVAGSDETGPGSTAPAPTAAGLENPRPARRLPPLTRRATLVAIAPLAAIALVLGAATVARNRVYASELTLWQDTVAKRPGNPRAHHNLGSAFAATGRTDEAIAEYQRAIALQPNHAFARCELGIALLSRGQPAEAEGQLRAALAADPGLAVARVNLGRALAALGRGDEAAVEYETVLRAEPDAVDARTNLAALLLARGDAARALTMLDEVTAAAPALAEPHYHRGLALEQLGRIEEAERALRRAAERKPDWPEPWVALGNVLAHRGATDEAERAYRAALRLHPPSAAAHYGLGNLAAQRREFAAAMEEFRAVLAADPTHLAARANLGNCQLVTGRVREAIATYEEVLRAQPDNAAVERNLALARELLRTGQSAP